MIPLQDKPNTTVPSAQNPYGQIQDDDGTGNGTPVTKEVYQDHHIFFDRLMGLAGVTPNGLLDNAYDGFQLIEALFKKFVSSDSSLGVKVKKTDIGAWDMTAGDRHMPHNLDVTKIISVKVMIINDIGTSYEPLEKADPVSGLVSGTWQMDATHIDLKAVIGQSYETGTAWDSLLVNRGYVVFHYID